MKSCSKNRTLLSSIVSIMMVVSSSSCLYNWSFSCSWSTFHAALGSKIDICSSEEIGNFVFYRDLISFFLSHSNFLAATSCQWTSSFSIHHNLSWICLCLLSSIIFSFCFFFSCICNPSSLVRDPYFWRCWDLDIFCSRSAICLFWWICSSCSWSWDWTRT